MLTDVSLNDVAQEICNITLPHFGSEFSVSAIPSDKLSLVYSTGLYNLIDGKTVIANRGKEFYKELSKVKFHVIGMKIKHGYRSGIEFTIKTSISNETRIIAFRDSDSTLNTRSYTIENLAINVHINKVIEAACKFLEQPMQLKRLSKSQAGKSMIKELVECMNNEDQQGYRYRSNERHSALSYFLQVFFKLDIHTKVKVHTVEECASILHLGMGNFDEGNRDRDYFTQHSASYIPVLAKVALLQRYGNDPQFEAEWKGGYLDKQQLIITANKTGYSTWIDGVMTFTEAAKAHVDLAFSNFRNKFTEYFSEGKWRVTEYSLRYNTFTLEYLHYGDEENSNRTAMVQFSGSVSDNDTLKLFRLFNVMDTLVTQLAKSLSLDMIMGISSNFLNGKEQNKAGNIRQIITLLTEKLESNEEEVL